MKLSGPLTEVSPLRMQAKDVFFYLCVVMDNMERGMIPPNFSVYIRPRDRSALRQMLNKCNRARDKWWV